MATVTKNKRTKPANEVRTSTSDVLKKEPSLLTIPVRELSSVSESIVCGFRQNMIECDGHGGVDVGAGLGTDFILLRWHGRSCLVRGTELLKAWVVTFATEDAERIA